jgi:Secretion system C-terminal sorting domain
MRTIYTIALFFVLTLNSNLQAKTRTNSITLDQFTLPTPNNLKVTTNANKTIQISWDLVAGAVLYNVSVTEGTITKFASLVAANTVSVAGLKSKTTYTIKVSAIDITGANNPNVSKLDYIIYDETIMQRRSKEFDSNQYNPIVSPNPFSDDLSVHIELFAGKNAELNLFDANGKLVRTQKMGEEAQTATINTYDLIPGMYVLHFHNDIINKTYKLIKVN